MGGPWRFGGLSRAGGSQGGGGRSLVGRLGLPRVELGQDVLGDALEQLLGEDAQQLPPDVQRLEDAPVLVGTWEKMQGREMQERGDVGWLVQTPKPPIPALGGVRLLPHPG